MNHHQHAFAPNVEPATYPMSAVELRTLLAQLDEPATEPATESARELPSTVETRVIPAVGERRVRPSETVTRTGGGSSVSETRVERVSVSPPELVPPFMAVPLPSPRPRQWLRERTEMLSDPSGLHSVSASPRMSRAHRDSTPELELPTLVYRGRARRALQRTCPPQRAPELSTLPGLGSVRPRDVPQVKAAAGVADVASRAESAGRGRALRLNDSDRQPRADGTLEHEDSATRVQRQMRWRTARLVFVLIALIGSAPLLFGLVEARGSVVQAGPSVPAGVAQALVPQRTYVEPELAALTTRAESTAPERAEAVRKAASLLRAGDRGAALAAFRVLSRASPEAPAIDEIVRVLERELRACATEGGTACRGNDLL